MAKPKRTKQNKKISEIILGSITELTTGITSEKLSAMFFDMTALKHQPEPMYRLDSGGHRYYYRYEGEKIVFYTSVTTMIKSTLPTSPQLINWLVSKGGDGKDEADERAIYGTFLHMECGRLLMNGHYNLDDLPTVLKPYLATNRLPEDRMKWVDDLKKDILAFAQFMIDTNCKPLAIELILWHPTDMYAGAIDLVCELDIEEKGFFGELYLSGANKGQPKETKRTNRVRAIVDIKSGRKSFYESHEIQLAAYAIMWNIHFPELPISKTFNWSPKEYRGVVPSYNLKDQSNSRKAKKLPYLVECAKIEDDSRSNVVTVIQGNIDLLKGIESNISEKSFSDLVRGKQVVK